MDPFCLTARHLELYNFAQSSILTQLYDGLPQTYHCDTIKGKLYTASVSTNRTCNMSPKLIHRVSWSGGEVDPSQIIVYQRLPNFRCGRLRAASLRGLSSLAGLTLRHNVNITKLRSLLRCTYTPSRSHSINSRVVSQCFAPHSTIHKAERYLTRHGAIPVKLRITFV